MSNREEHQGLQEYEQEWDHIKLPQAKLDQAIFYGMERGKRKKQWLQPLKWSGIAASVMIVILLSTIRLSPTVAAYVSQVPGMQLIVSLISQDKGLQQAMNHDYFQTIDAAVEHEDIKLSVDQIMLDETRLILFYTIDAQSENDHPRLGKMNILDAQGEVIPAGISSSGPSYDETESDKQTNKLEFYFQQGFAIPERMTFQTTIEGFEEEKVEAVQVGEPAVEPILLNHTWSVTFDIDQEKFNALKKVYPINQSIEIEGQQIHFHEAVVYPTRTALKVEFDGDNSKEIFGFDDIRLVNEKGEEFNTISGMSYWDGINRIYHFESNFFEETESLYIKFSSLRALDKDKLEVILDLEKERFTQKSDELLQFESIERGTLGIRVNYQMTVNQPIDESISYSPLSWEFRDADGKEYRSGAGGTFTTAEEEYTNNVYMYLPNEDYANPLTFTITNYPERIEGKTTIQIDLNK